MTDTEVADAVEAIWTKAYIDRQKVFIKANQELDKLYHQLTPEQKQIFETHIPVG